MREIIQALIIGLFLIGVLLMSGCIGEEKKQVTEENKTNATDNETVKNLPEDELPPGLPEIETLLEKEEVYNPPPGFETYTDEENGFRISYPSSWTKEVWTSGVIFMSPYEATGGTCSVVVKDVPPPMTLSEYTDLMVNEASDLSDGTRKVDRKNIKIRTLDASQLVYSYPQDGFDVKRSETYMLKNAKVYSITCGGLGAAYTKHKDSFDKIVESFDFI